MLSRSTTAQVCFIGAAALPAVFAPFAVFATVYMSAADAARLMFPEATAFAPRPKLPTPEQAQLIAAHSDGSAASTAFWKVSTAMAGDLVLGYVISDSVVGKFDLIDYAVALAPDGTIRDVEILAYREAHGGEVRTTAWRRQFVGKNASAPLAIGDDIANISGATLSCTHLTDGIRRIARYGQLVLAKG
jgi:hypothetical protein